MTVILVWLMWVIISVPFISGISMSISMRAGCSLCRMVSASITWLQANTCQESPAMRRSISWRSWSWSLSSSRIRTLWLANSCRAFFLLSESLASWWSDVCLISSCESSFGAGSIGSVTMKLEPLPKVERSRISPPRSDTSSWVIDDPGPVPWIPCALFNLVNAWNTFRFSSSVIPLPVSFTLMVSVSLPMILETRASMLTLPWSVYLMALLTRLSRIWRIRKASARNNSLSVSFSWFASFFIPIVISYEMAKPFSSARNRIPSTDSFTSWVGEKETGWTFISPFSNWW